VAVGGDVRLSTRRFMDIICREMAASGLDVFDIGFVPTPISYFSLFHLPVEGLVMVTASHNPAEFNGFKLGLNQTTIYGKEIQKVLKITQARRFRIGAGSVEKREISTAYCDMLKEKFSFKRQFKIVVDCGNGTSALFAPKLLREMGQEVIELFCEPDGRFPNHHPDPTVEANLKDLIDKVAETDADFGVAYDGDSDRIGIVDDRGKIIWGDMLLLIFSLEILKKKPGAKTIFEVKCSQALPEELERAGGVPIMWKTGHSLLKSKMKETGAEIAGEMSGHMFFADDYFGYDDAMYATLRLIEILDKGNEALSTINGRLPFYFSTPEIRCECRDDKAKFEITEKAIAFFSKNYESIDIDGVRVLFGDGWGLIRSSNTQPVLVLRFEAKTEARLEEIKTLVVNKLREFGDFKI